MRAGLFSFNLVIEKLLIPTSGLPTLSDNLCPQFQSRNRETFDSNDKVPLGWMYHTMRFNLVIEKLLIPTQRA